MRLRIEAVAGLGRVFGGLRGQPRGGLLGPLPVRSRRAPKMFAILMAIAVAVAIEGNDRTVGASSGDGTFDPTGRGLQLLGGREAILREQSERTRRAARLRGVTLYRLLRSAAIERRGGSAGDSRPMGDRLGGRTVALVTAVLDRDLREARLLHAELDLVRADRATLAGRPDARAATEDVPPSPLPRDLFMRPVSGDLAKPFGVERDPATGVWIFRAAASFFARASEPVRSPAAGRVVRVGGSIAGGTGVVLAHDQGNWTTVVSGLASVAVAAGEKVSRGDPLGRAAPQPESTIRVETWRGRTPIDPTSVLGAR